MKTDEMGKACGTHGTEEIHTELDGDPEGKRPLGRLRLKWGNSVKIELKEIVLEGLGLVHLAENRHKWRAVVNTLMNLWVL
jgi:hypothetical protein